jgi:oligogalacturonide lyase
VSSGISRRALLCTIPVAVGAQVKQPQAKKAKPFPEAGEFTRVTDPVTENVIVRLTALSSSSVIPLARNHFVSARERILVFASDRGGHFCPFLVDLRTGGLRQLAETSKLNARSLCLDKQEKTVRYLDGGELFEVGLNRGSAKKIGEGYSTFNSGSDGSLFLISDGKLLHKAGGNLQELAEGATDVWPQPNSPGCLFSRATGPDEAEFYFQGGPDGSAKPLLVAGGRVREPFWDADGESILFLRDVTAPSGAILAEIHSKDVRGGSENVVSTTSQFACFAVNSDATVFVGASRSRAQPNVILMLRQPHREMTLCEHHSSHPGEVSPVFSPDNRRVYFESDREGKPAIYSVNVESLIEPPA